MTTPAHAIEIGSQLPSADMVASADMLKRAIVYQLERGNRVQFRVEEDGVQRPVTLEPDLSALLIQILDHLGNGEGVTFVPIQKRMTTQQAADILNVSRPYLIKLLESGKMPFEKIGRHRRVLARDLFAYKRERDRQRDEALDALFAEDGQLY